MMYKKVSTFKRTTYKEMCNVIIYPFFFIKEFNSRRGSLSNTQFKKIVMSRLQEK